MILLALDLATQTGAAVGATDGTAPRASTISFGEAGAAHPARFYACMTWLNTFIKAEGVERIAIEEAIAGGVVGRQNRVQLAMGWRAVVMATAHMRGIRVIECPISKVRAHFAGHGAAIKGQGKPETVRRCEHLGWAIENEDEADACAVWAWARWKLTGVSLPSPFGLFDHAHPPRNEVG